MMICDNNDDDNNGQNNMDNITDFADCGDGDTIKTMVLIRVVLTITIISNW